MTIGAEMLQMHCSSTSACREEISKYVKMIQTKRLNVLYLGPLYLLLMLKVVQLLELLWNEIKT